MKAKTYAEKLLDPRWQKKRLELFQKKNWQCEGCGNRSETLHAHHKAYRKCQPWEYDISELRCLCERCHGRVEDYKKEIGKILIELLPLDLSWVLKTLRDRFSNDPILDVDEGKPPNDEELRTFFDSLKTLLDTCK
jgi:hypothetical protein